MEHGGCSVGGSEAVDLLVMTLQFCTFCLQVRAKVHMPHSQVLRPPLFSCSEQQPLKPRTSAGPLSGPVPWCGSLPASFSISWWFSKSFPLYISSPQPPTTAAKDLASPSLLRTIFFPSIIFQPGLQRPRSEQTERVPGQAL